MVEAISLIVDCQSLVFCVRAMMRLVDKVTDAFVNNASALLAGQLQGSLFDHCEPSVASGINSAKTLAKEQIFNHPSKVRMELMANQCLHRLLDALMPLATMNADEPMTFEQQRLLRLVQGHFTDHHRTLSHHIYDNVLNILDYLTGMNDHEAYSLAQDLNGTRSGVW